MPRKIKQYTNPFFKSKKPLVAIDPSGLLNIQSAISLHQKGQLDQAQALYLKLLEIEPKNADALNLLGVIAYQTGNNLAAVDLIGQAIEINPDLASFYSNRGNSLQELKQLEAAVASFDKAIELKPDYTLAYYNRGNALKELKHLEAAVASFDKAIELKPDYSDAYSNRGVALQELKQLDAAVASYNTAIELSPDLTDAYSNRGLALKDLKQLGAALASFEKAIELKPDHAEAYSNRGVALYELKEFDVALASYDKAIELKPGYADAYWNKSLLLLLTRNFNKGFSLYEWRWERVECLKLKRNFSQPLLIEDESLSGKTVLLHAEQGLGDTIQFCRYIKMVSDLGARVIFEVQKPLVRLLKDLCGISTLIAKGDPLPEFDFHCPLLSLPLVFKTDLNSIPSAKSYLEAESERVAYWRDRIKGNKFKIGIAWQGSQGTKVDIGRSFELKLFESIAGLPNVHLISLQKGYGSEQLRNMPTGMRVLDLGEELDVDGAFLDSAAVMMNLDLVITSDTALAHLAGALGVKTWIALKYVPDWRWMLDRKDTPWYPSVTLYRQEKIDDWVPVFNQIKTDIISIQHVII
jgi:tetratricopeptide (TPR) repeat protein